VITSTISETKNRLSELLRKVQEGETLVILDRRQPIARVERMSGAAVTPHLHPSRTGRHPSESLSLAIGGTSGKPSGAVTALIEEREAAR
jgi:antitoxin (DNA-binding transcriptional repressor) of toxin-antitoxin stability system